MADADTVYILEDQDESVQRMIDYFRTGQTEITDFNEGSIVTGKQIGRAHV